MSQGTFRRPSLVSTPSLAVLPPPLPEDETDGTTLFAPPSLSFLVPFSPVLPSFSLSVVLPLPSVVLSSVHLDSCPYICLLSFLCLSPRRTAPSGIPPTPFERGSKDSCKDPTRSQGGEKDRSSSKRRGVINLSRPERLRKMNESSTTTPGCVSSLGKSRCGGPRLGS